ncbi:hypothetical protein OL239_05935 [Arthrobacter sp. ATA002]|uniref:ComF family protein n=1 Tax=Arthrobacter sp. ATA002 TaxID=2991715 RepID=UPI0022A6FF9B|nr:hypothetical protein [Arthrobacter sp. ATA002]WAP52734.1 hypothetical protein OL239_05935 [Arthrobacter sp. ATA002]
MDPFPRSMSQAGRTADRCRQHPWPAAAAAACAELAAALLPTSCVVCGAPDATLCPGCRRIVRRSGTRPYYAHEAAELLPPAEAETGSAADGGGLQVLPVLAAGRYAGPLARVLLAYKNHGRTNLAAVLGPMLAGALHQAADDAGRRGLVLVPVPGTWRARRRRGYNPLDLLLGALRTRGCFLPELPWNRCCGSPGRGPGSCCVPKRSVRLFCGAPAAAKNNWDGRGAAPMFTEL